MNEASEARRFEEAARLRDQLAGLTELHSEQIQHGAPGRVTWMSSPSSGSRVNTR